MKVQSPLTGGVADKICSVPCSMICFDYEKILGIDVTSYFENLDSVDEYQCVESGYRFFSPDTVAGNDDLYQKLESFDWYYNPWKWEHSKSFKQISNNSDVLEIGCAKGSFIRELKNKKECRCKGIELNKKAAQHARESGLDVHEDLIQEFSKLHKGMFDYVCCFQVLEHISNVNSFLSGCIDCLKVGGRFLIAVPNNNSFIKHDSTALLNQPPHHMGKWTEQSLRYIANVFSLKVVSVKFEPLQPYHQKWYFDILKSRMLRCKTGRIFFSKLCAEKWFRKWVYLLSFAIRGHTVLIEFEKT